MESKPEHQEFEKTISGEDFDFDFDEDFESEVRSEYMVMGAMRFDRDAGTASCNFEIDEDDDDAFRIPGEKARKEAAGTAEENAADGKKARSKKSGK
jgi:hypothetical protein